jgi:hypothetical protein
MHYTGTDTYNYKLLLSECKQFYIKLIVTIRKTLRLSRHTSPQSLIKNHTQENSSRKTSPSYLIRKYPPTVYPNKPLHKFCNLFFNTFWCLLYKKLSQLNLNPKFSIWYDKIILTNSCNTRSRKSKALSIVHPTYSKISLKMALQFGRNM